MFGDDKKIQSVTRAFSEQWQDFAFHGVHVCGSDKERIDTPGTDP